MSSEITHQQKFAAAEGMLNHIYKVDGRMGKIHALMDFAQKIYDIARLHEQEDGNAQHPAVEALKLPKPPTKGDYKKAQIIDEEESYDCPMCEGDGCVTGEQYVNFDGKPLNILFSGIGNEFQEWQKWFDACLALTSQTPAETSEKP